jgi:hypothetical protein
MRRTHLRGHTNILKRLLVHVGGFNLGLFMRTRFGIGTPRGLQGRTSAFLAYLVALWTLMVSLWRDPGARSTDRIPRASVSRVHTATGQLVTGSPLTSAC